MLATHCHLAVQDFRESADFFFYNVFFKIRRERRVDANESVVAETFDEVLELFISYRNIFVVSVIVAT